MRFVYHAEVRTVHPHAVFVSRDGSILLSGTEPPHKGWRSFHLDEIAGLEILDRGFTPDRRFDPQSPTYYRIVCDVAEGATSDRDRGSSGKPPAG